MADAAGARHADSFVLLCFEKRQKRRGGGGGGGEIIVDVVSKVAHTDTREDGWKESKLLKKGCLGNVFMILYPHFGCSDG
jgi:hypothetical protein